MKYAEHVAASRTMDSKSLADCLAGLTMDPRFAAVVALIERDKMEFTVAGSNQSIAGDHGKMAHCMGSVHALVILEGQIKQFTDAAPRRGEKPPPKRD